MTATILPFRQPDEPAEPPPEPEPSREEVMRENARLQDWNLWLFLLAIIGGVGWVVALLRGC